MSKAIAVVLIIAALAALGALVFVLARPKGGVRQTTVAGGSSGGGLVNLFAQLFANGVNGGSTTRPPPLPAVGSTVDIPGGAYRGGKVRPTTAPSDEDYRADLERNYGTAALSGGGTAHLQADAYRNSEDASDADMNATDPSQLAGG